MLVCQRTAYSAQYYVCRQSSAYFPTGLAMPFIVHVMDLEGRTVINAVRQWTLLVGPVASSVVKPRVSHRCTGGESYLTFLLIHSSVGALGLVSTNGSVRIRNSGLTYRSMFNHWAAETATDKTLYRAIYYLIQRWLSMWYKRGGNGTGDGWSGASSFILICFLWSLYILTGSKLLQNYFWWFQIEYSVPFGRQIS